MANDNFRSPIFLLSTVFLVLLSFLALASFWPRPLWGLAGLLQVMPLWPLVVSVVAILFLAISKKERPAIIFSGLSILVLIFPVMGFNIPISKVSSQDQVIRILTANLGGKVDWEDLKELIKDEQPDVMVFQEMGFDQAPKMEKYFSDGTWHMEFTRGLGIVSRFEFKSIGVLARVASWGQVTYSAEYELNGPSGKFYFFNTHLATLRPALESLMNVRWQGLKALRGWKDARVVFQWQETELKEVARRASQREAVIVAGDFNMAQANPVFHRYVSRFTDAFAAAGLGFGYTKFTRWHGVRIDHVLFDSSWRVVDVRVGPDNGGDHRPVIGDFIVSRTARVQN